MTPIDLYTLAMIAAGAFFFFAGTLGLLRFPDLHSRLHALTKADNLGLGLIVLGLLPRMGDVATMLKMLLVWVLVVGAAATVAQLIARIALPGHLRSRPKDDGR